MPYTMTMKRIATALASLGILALAIFAISIPTASVPAPTLGATNTQNLIGGFPYFLAGSGISSTATTLTLTSLTLPQTGYEIQTTDLSSPFYVTFEAGNTSKQEFASCTTVTQSPSNTTATLSGCVRGLLPLTPYTASSTYAFSHSGGTTVIFSNPPQVYNGFYALGNAATSTNILVFSSTTPPRYDFVGVQSNGSFIATTSELASVAYVNAVALTSAPNASTGAKGVVQLATGLQAASSTALGGTGAVLVPPASLATDTPNTLTRGSRLLMSQIGGYLNQGWLDLTSAATWAFNGTVSIAASVSFPFTLNGVAYKFPTTSSTASSSVLLSDGANSLSWFTSSHVLLASSTPSSWNNQVVGGGASTTVFRFTVPANQVGTSNMIDCKLYGTLVLASSVSQDFSLEASYGAAATTTFRITSAHGQANTTNKGYFEVMILGNGSTSSQKINSLVNMFNQNFGNIASSTALFAYSGATTISTNSAVAQPFILMMAEPAAGGSPGTSWTPDMAVCELKS